MAFQPKPKHKLGGLTYLRLPSTLGARKDGWTGPGVKSCEARLPDTADISVCLERPK